MEGAAHDATAGLVRQLPGPVEHFLSRPSGEGEQEDRFRQDPLLYQIGHSVDEGPGLAAACPCNHQDRPVAMGNGSILGGIQDFGSNGGGYSGGLMVLVGGW